MLLEHLHGFYCRASRSLQQKAQSVTPQCLRFAPPRVLTKHRIEQKYISLRDVLWELPYTRVELSLLGILRHDGDTHLGVEQLRLSRLLILFVRLRSSFSAP